MRQINIAIHLFYLINVGLAFGIVVGTMLWPRGQWLAKASIENGPYEVATAIILFIGGLCLVWRAWVTTSRQWRIRLGSAAMALLCFVGAGEEISWGQHWLHFETNDFFKSHNYQSETNLHNLMDPVIFSTAINVVIYAIFTLLPLIHWAFPSNPISRLLSQWKLTPFVPNLTIALWLMLANCFHAWLIPATYSDSIVLVTCWIFAVVLLLNKKDILRPPLSIVSLLLCLAGFGICIWAAGVFKHENMQYEIRECLTAFVVVYWALGWSGAIKSIEN